MEILEIFRENYRRPVPKKSPDKTKKHHLKLIPRLDKDILHDREIYQLSVYKE